MNHPLLSLKVGERWTSEELVEPTSAGYLWSVQSPGPWLDVRIEHAPAVPTTEAEAMVGGFCTVRLVVEALAPGEGQIEARCARPWEPADSPDATHYRQAVVVR